MLDHPYYHPLPTDMIDNFGLGVDRWREVTAWEDYLTREDEVIINLGAGKKMIEGTDVLDLPDWWAGMEMPYDDNSVTLILAYHFFEHLDKQQILNVLREVERVLKPGAFMNVVTPHWSSEAAHQDIDHKSFWSESTWRNMFENPYYDGPVPRNWRLTEAQTIIMGVVQRNLMIVSQIRKAYGERV